MVAVGHPSPHGLVHPAHDGAARSCTLHDAPAEVAAATTGVAAPRVNARTRRRRRSGGFTLLELMITLVVLAVGVLALGQMMPAGSRAMNRSRSRTSGTALAAQKVEDLKSLAWTDTNLSAGNRSDTSGKYTRTWVITDNVPLTGTKKIAVTVAWNSSSGSRSTVLTTYLTQFAN